MTKKLVAYKEYEKLKENLQLDLLQREGIYVGKRKLAGRVVILFQLNDFYVEVYYQHYRKVIDHLVISDDTGILQPYLDQICIPEFIKKSNI